jgi:Spx/MgsR family transcriptional regulator
MPAESSKKAPRGPVVKVFGIKNCDTCRSALKWLESKEVPYRFHDVRERPPDAGLVDIWCASPHAHKLLNRRSTTWRQLNGKQRAAALGNPAPSLREHPTLIKRPVFMIGRDVIAVGFLPEEMEKKLS